LYRSFAAWFARFGFRVLVRVFGAVVAAGVVGVGGVDALGVRGRARPAAKSW
jgi:hypothetical protein